MRQTFCAFCGKATSKQLEHVELTNDETYEGNLQIVSKKTTRYDWDVWKTVTNDADRVIIKKRTYLSLWDGESYEPLRYGNFCKLNCCKAFANGAYAAGFRVG
jgi:hypothetical protein